MHKTPVLATDFLVPGGHGTQSLFVLVPVKNSPSGQLGSSRPAVLLTLMASRPEVLK